MPKNRVLGRLFLGILLLSLIPGCHQVRMTKEVNRTEKLAHQITDEALDYLEPCPLPHLTGTLKKGLARDEAIRIALLNNRALRASFQELGIAKADLVQAGLLQNPVVSAAFNIPKADRGIVTNIEIDAQVLSLTDLWQLPLRKKAYSSQLDEAIHRLVSQIFTTMTQARHAYDEVLFFKALLENTQTMKMLAANLRDALTQRYQFGLENDADVYLAEASVGYWDMKVTKLTALLVRAQIYLTYVLGIDSACYDTLMVTDAFSAPPSVPDKAILHAWACSNHPEIQRARKKICSLESFLAYERSRRVRAADIGIAFKQDFEEGRRGVGPYVGVEVPLFDSNQARIARAEFNLKKARQQLCDIQLRIASDIDAHYTMLASLRTIVDTYEEKIMSFHKKALEYSIEYQKIMQITVPEVIQRQKELYRAQRNLLKNLHQALSEYTDLEQAVGRRLRGLSGPEKDQKL